jgi:hypothetical protein
MEMTSNDDTATRDPGWSNARTAAFRAILMPLSTRRKVATPLELFRSLWLSFVGAILMFGIVITVFHPRSDGNSATVTSLGLAAAGFVSLGAVAGLRSRPLRITSADELPNAWRTRFFVQVLAAELPALFAFSATFIVGPAGLYWIGAAFSLLGFALMAPTAAEIERRQSQLLEAGSPLVLLDALLAPPVSRQ